MIPPFVAFYDMRAVTFVLTDEMADVSIAGLQWFILIPRLNHTGLSLSLNISILHRLRNKFLQLILISLDSVTRSSIFSTGIEPVTSCSRILHVTD